MDTYLNVSFDCVKCGRCVKVCQEKGYGHLYGGRGRTPETWDDNLCCHHCGSPCIDVCHYGAISIKRF